MCTPNGLKLATFMGEMLLTVLGSRQIEAIADDVQRCEDSAVALGLTKHVHVDQALFDPLSAKVSGCAQPDWEGTVTAEVEQARDKLGSARSLLPRLQEILGKGVAPPLSDIPDVVADGYFVGGLRAASESVIETFELEKTSSMPMAWGKLSDAEFRKLYTVRRTYFEVMYGGRDIAQRYASGILAKLLAVAALPPATVLVGHDIQLEAVHMLLGISWQCGPFSTNSTPPLSGIMFTLAENSVRVQSVCPSLQDSSPVVVGDASFADGRSELPASDFSVLLKSAIEWRCVNASVPEERGILFA
uniref:Uncharacterized protein n=1 Tax=Alexandrium monilatum TaxID=311494 RepID=A0A7S4QCT4_9DINO